MGKLTMPKQPKHKSARADGRGGWTTGKRRHENVGDWQRIRLRIVSLLNDRPQYGVISARAISLALGVSDRTVRRWLQGEDRPSPADQERLRAWAAEQ